MSPSLLSLALLLSDPMPLYEYEATEDGEIVTLLRPMSEAYAPV